jgi:hypothetical protein
MGGEGKGLALRGGGKPFIGRQGDELVRVRLEKLGFPLGAAFAKDFRAGGKDGGGRKQVGARDLVAAEIGVREIAEFQGVLNSDGVHDFLVFLVFCCGAKCVAMGKSWVRLSRHASSFLLFFGKSHLTREKAISAT